MMKEKNSNHFIFQPNRTEALLTEVALIKIDNVSSGCDVPKSASNKQRIEKIISEVNKRNFWRPNYVGKKLVSELVLSAEDRLKEKSCQLEKREQELLQKLD